MNAKNLTSTWMLVKKMPLNIKATVILIIVGALGIIPMNLGKESEGTRSLRKKRNHTDHSTSEIA